MLGFVILGYWVCLCVLCGVLEILNTILHVTILSSTFLSIWGLLVSLCMVAVLYTTNFTVCWAINQSVSMWIRRSTSRCWRGHEEIGRSQRLSRYRCQAELHWSTARALWQGPQRDTGTLYDREINCMSVHRLISLLGQHYKKPFFKFHLIRDHCCVPS